jgi:tetratricopeptide (TPR) repeat protein
MLNGLTKALLMALLTAHSTGALCADPSKIFVQLRNSVLAIEMRDAKGTPTSTHTAIVAAPRRVITACDVLDGAVTPFVLSGTTAHKGELKARDTQRNLCLLDVAELDAPVAPLPATPAMPAVGARVYAVSNALGLGVGITEGVVAGIREFADRRYIQFSAPISPGSEGGALVNEAGQIIGVIDYRHRDGQNVNFAAPAQWIAEVEARKVPDGGRQKFMARAAQLYREKQWPELTELSREWSATNADDIEAWRVLAQAAALQSNLDTEEKAWREIRRINPAMVSAGVGLSRVMLKRKQYSEALELARSLLALRQEDADVWVAIGQAELMLNNLDRADEAYRRAISYFPWADGAVNGLVAVAERRGDRAAITSAWQRMARLYPDVTYVQIRLIGAYVGENRAAKALPLVERLLEREPGNGDAWFMKGTVLTAFGRPADAIAAFRSSLDKSPTNPAFIWGSMGDAYFGLSMFPEAIRAYREAVSLSKGEWRWRFWLTVALKDGGYLDEAIAIDEKMVVERPDDPSTFRQLGFALASAGRNEEAAKALERSLTLEPNQPKTWHALMETYHANGRIDDMRRTYNKLRDLDSARAELAYKALILPNEEPK